MNWTDVLDDLRHRGWTQSALAAHIGTTQSVLSELRSGKTADPRFSTGDALRALHESGARHESAAQQDA